MKLGHLFLEVAFFIFTGHDCILNYPLDTPLEHVPSIGKAKASLLQSELNLQTVEDLITFYPFRYVDRSLVQKIYELNSSGSYVQIRGKLGPMKEEGEGRKKRLRATLSDETGVVELIWFKGHKWLKDALKPGREYLVYGKTGVYNRVLNIPHPEMERVEEGAVTKGFLQPVYRSGEKLNRRGLNSKGIEKIISGLITPNSNYYFESLPSALRSEFKLISKNSAIYFIHRPASQKQILHAQRRLKFEELFFHQLELALKKELRQKKIRGFIFDKIGDYFNRFYEECLPFALTAAQKRVIREIRRDLNSGRQMNRLLQGDVGSGKTIVAALSCLIALDNGYQATLMAPTEILANQHFESLSELLRPLDIKVELLTGSTKTAVRKQIDAACRSGELHILVGTHALLEKRVVFKNLGIAIIDEQHRFGVAQRARLWMKNNLPPHILVMTATPIPRTLAMTLYGDLDVSIIDELPPGRKPIQTVHFYDSGRLRVFGFIEKQIALGRQVYIVYPLIEESSTLDLKDLMDGFESISRRFPRPKYQISIVHGKMKPSDKDFEMARFAKGETQIMVATTVIEVGVNVPNATVMVVESAQRFGLSQLHQLRGRVGRGAEKSYCILITDLKLSKEGKERIKTMVSTNDGFRISEADLRLRGPGDLMGTRQSGILDLKIADLSSDTKILQFARNAALELVEDDPLFEKPENAPLAKEIKRIIKNKPNWSRIS
jgi:ATP-dependent DNA helicase RecG